MGWQVIHPSTPVERREVFPEPPDPDDAMDPPSGSVAPVEGVDPQDFLVGIKPSDEPLPF